tara:strand:+ start:96 stop:980 length:885 start_codon:yes stop_codon:yes gene_type:complete
MTPNKGSNLPAFVVGAILALAFVGLFLQKHPPALSGLGITPHQISGSLEPSEVVTHTPEANTQLSRQEWREEQDLIAQRYMAKWTLWMLIVSGFGVLVGFLGLVFLKGTLDAALRANQQARDSIDTTREIGMAQIRAYLTLEEAEMQYSDSDVRLAFEIHNCGQSPALFVSATYVGCRVVLGGTPDEVSSFSTSYKEHYSVFLGSCKAAGTMRVWIPMNFGQSEASTINARRLSGEGLVVLQGLIGWKDVFGVDQSQPFVVHHFLRPGISDAVDIQCDNITEAQVRRTWATMRG